MLPKETPGLVSPAAEVQWFAGGQHCQPNVADSGRRVGRGGSGSIEERRPGSDPAHQNSDGTSNQTYRRVGSAPFLYLLVAGSEPFRCADCDNSLSIVTDSLLSAQCSLGLAQAST